MGTFTPQGTFDAAAERLPYLASLGITAVELMPVAEFPGSVNWATTACTCTPRRAATVVPRPSANLVDACHGVGLSYCSTSCTTTLAPRGTTWDSTAPTSRIATRRLGQAVNFDGAGSDGVRRHFVENAKYWIDEFHLDGLRLDAIHAIFDFGADHILCQLAREAHAHARALGRRVTLIAESDLNDVRVTSPTERGGHGI